MVANFKHIATHGSFTAGGTFTAVFMGAAAVQGGMIEGGNQYLDMLDKGIPEPTARNLAFGVYAPVAGAHEAVAGKYFIAPFKGAAMKLGAKALPAALRPRLAVLRVVMAPS